MVVFLAAVASLIFPGAGQAFVCRTKCVVVWGLAGFVPVLLALVWAPALGLAVPIRIASAIHAAVIVRRARIQRPNLHLAGVASIAQAVLLAVVRLLVMETFRAQSSSMLPALDFEDHFVVDKLVPRLVGYERGEIVVFIHPTGHTYVKRLIAVGGDAVEVRNGALRVNGIAVTASPIGPTTYVDRDEVRGSQTTRKVIAVRESYAGHSYVIFHEPGGGELNDFPTAEHDCAAATGADWPGGEVAYPQPAMTAAPDGHSCVVPAGTYFFLGDNRDNSNDSRRWGVIPAGKVVGRVVGRWWAKDLGRLGGVD